jgi:lipid-binding SYLF domain-containing protein
MQKFIIVFFISQLLTSINFPQGIVGGYDAEVLENANNTIEMILEKDPGLQAFFDKAYGYAVFPSVGKGAVGIGGAHGNGTVFEQGNPVGKTTLTQFTIGFQFGGKYYSEIIFFEDEETLELFKTSRFELAAQVSAVAITLGASADLAYSGGVAIVTIEKGGLMYEASVGGQKFGYEAVNDFEENRDTQDNESGY